MIESQSWFIWMLSQLPALYIVITGILICWGIEIVVAFQSIMKHVRPGGIRFCDKAHVAVTLIILFANTLGMFFTTQQVVEHVDVLLVVNVWIAAYYAFLTFSNLKDWPRLFFSGNIRERERLPNEPYSR